MTNRNIGNVKKHLFVLFPLIFLGSCGEYSPPEQQAQVVRYQAANVTTSRLLQAGSEPSQWMTYGGTFEEQRYSSLKQITKDNISQLGLVWYADYEGYAGYDTNLLEEGTPLFIDGVIYVSTAWSKLYAFNGKTGEQLWLYDPEVPGEWAENVCCGLVNRGIAAYNGKIYIGTLDGRLVAVDADSGKEVWSIVTIDKNARYSITGAPQIAKGRVLISNSGADFGVRGYLSAYDAETGELAWRFYTVPGDPKKGFENDAMAKAAETWNGEWWEKGGGGTVWDAIVYDPKTNLVYFGVGNGSPWNAQERSPGGGDNLFLSSIVALNADTGEYVWHYQTTPWETWDYTATQPIMIVDLEIGGRERRVVVQAPKNGFFYVLDAATGELISADAYTEINWADGIDMATGRPMVRPEARYNLTGKPFNALPGPQGGHSWHSMAYSPETNYIYIPVQYAWFPFVADPNYEPHDMGFNLGIDLGAVESFYRDNPNEPNEFIAYLIAWDPIERKEVWRSERNQGPTGGALTTASSLVFQGGGSSQEFRAYDAVTGEKVWSMQAQTGVFAAPISFELDGNQFIAISVGGNQAGGYFVPNYSRLLVFGLGGTLALPPLQEYTQRPLNPPVATALADAVAEGRVHYFQYCGRCHGVEGQSPNSVFPDLTRTPMLHTQWGFDQVVLQGIRSKNGMPSFSSALSEGESADLRAYLIARANELKGMLIK